MEGEQVVGIVGGGQLGRMLTQAATSLGFKVVVVDPTDHCPAAQVGAKQILGQLHDEAALKKLAEVSDFITIEIEHLNARILKTIESLGIPVNTKPDTIELIQDKYQQKEFLKAKDLPVAEFEKIDNLNNAKKVLKKFNGSMILKTRRNAFDGRGNMVVANLGDLDKAYEKFAGSELYAERILDFKKELAVIVAKDVNNNLKSYPLVETVHERNICVEVLAPAPVSRKIEKAAIDLGEKVVDSLQGAGIYAVELFLLKNGKLIINEIAPRVHNSGHLTMDACETSQFSQHIRAITGLPLGNTNLIAPAACMINVLGEQNGPTKIEGRAEVLKNPSASLHFYGKSPTKVDRKMGHINVVANTVDEARKQARAARKLIKV